MRKRVLLVLNSGEQLGGVERHVGDLLRELTDQVDFWVVCRNGPAVREYERYGVTYIDDYPRWEADLFYAGRIFRLIRREKINVVHAHQLRAGTLAIFAAWLAGCPKRIYHVHTPITSWRLPDWKRRTLFKFNWLVNFLVGNLWATDVIALTEVIRTERASREKIRASKIRVIPNGVDLKTYQLPKDDYLKLRQKARRQWRVKEETVVVGNIGRLTEEKGHQLLLAAIPSVMGGVDRPVKFVLASAGRLEKSLRRQVRELGISRRILFLGGFDDADKAALYAGFDDFVLPSLAEGFGIVLVEAMAAGLPVVAADLPVFQEVSGGTVEFFRSGDAADLAAKLRKLIGDKNQAKKLGLKARVRARTFSLSKFGRAYAKLYES